MYDDFQLEIFEMKYKSVDDKKIEDMWSRTSKAIASLEKFPAVWSVQFDKIQQDFKFIAGGRINNGAGTKNNYLLNCGTASLCDNLVGEESIARTAERVAYMSKRNYGCGLNFEPIRPRGYRLSDGGEASGVVSFMNIFNVWCGVIKSGGANRRAALIGILPIYHPEIFDFIRAKREKDALTNFNTSVGLTLEFINAVKCDGDFELHWNGTVDRVIKARDLWKVLVESGFLYNDPGIVMLDEINKFNNMSYLYDIDATNPCGEIPLPSGNKPMKNGKKMAGGVCDLGNINVTRFIIEPFADCEDWEDNFNWKEYTETIVTAVRFLDNVLDVSDFPYDDLAEAARNDRRIGLNAVAGLGSFLAMMKIPYDSELAIKVAKTLQSYATNTAYAASVELSIEKGSFPNFNKEEFLKSKFVNERLDPIIKEMIQQFGIRNCALMTIPPVGTGSLIAGNISSGLEPIFDLQYYRKVNVADGQKEVCVEDYAWKLYKKHVAYQGNEILGVTPPEFFKTARDISPKAHIDMQAALQYYIDGSISKTCNMPSTTTLEQYEELLMYAIDSGVKGFTSYIDGSRDCVLSSTSTLISVPVTGNLITDNPNPAPVIKFVDSSAKKRPRKLSAEVTQIPEPNGKHTYCTIAHMVDEFGVSRPWEIFLNSSGNNDEWYAAVGRLASRLMRKTGDVQGVIDELKEIGGQNGYLTKEFGYVQSRPQHIGFLLEEYVTGLNTTYVIEPHEDKDGKVVYSGSLCKVCCGKIIKRGGCKQCENGCPDSYVCG